MASTRTRTKSALSALRSSRAAKLSLSQSGSLLHRSRAARAVSTFTSPLYLSSRTRVFDGIAENDVVSVKLSLASGGGFARRFHSSTPLQSSAASSASQANQDEFTDMAWEGFINAFDAAIVCGQKVVDSEHLMKSLLELNGDLARRIFTKAGSDYFLVWKATEDFISQQPQVTDRSSALDMGPHIVSILDNALKIKKQMGDDFASVEHLLMAFHSDKRFGQELFKNLELTEIKLKDAITDIRGNHKVTNRRPGELYEALKKIWEQSDRAC